MKVFTLNDVANSICTHEEVGSPWEERYGIDDHFNGLCALSQMGSAKPIVPTPEPEPEASPTDIEGPNSDWTKAAFHSMGGKTGFIAYCKANPAQMWPQLVKLNLPQLLKESEPLAKLEEIPLTDLDNMSSVDIKRLLLASQGITTTRQVEALNTEKQSK